MVATIKIIRWTGPTSAPVKTDITNSTNRASTEDNPASGNANPIPVPSDATTNRSYWVCTRLSSTAAPSTAINTVKWYSDGTNSMGTGVTLNVAVASTTGGASGYRAAVGTVGASGSTLNTTNYDALKAATSDAFTWTSAAQLTVAGSIGNTTGDFGEFVVYQVAVTSAANPGQTTAEQVSWQFDET